MFNNKLVVRAGWGMYYDRGELFAYLSPGFAAGVIPGGPFGVNQAPPFVSSQSCSIFSRSTLYNFFVPTAFLKTEAPSRTRGAPNTPTQPSGNPADINKFIPNTGTPGVGVAAGISEGNHFSSSPITTGRTSFPTL